MLNVGKEFFSLCKNECHFIYFIFEWKHNNKLNIKTFFPFRLLPSENILNIY